MHTTHTATDYDPLPGRSVFEPTTAVPNVPPPAPVPQRSTASFIAARTCSFWPMPR